MPSLPAITAGIMTDPAADTSDTELTPEVISEARKLTEKKNKKLVRVPYGFYRVQ